MLIYKVCCGIPSTALSPALFVMPAQAGIQGRRGWIPAFAGMAEASCQFVAQILLARLCSNEITKDSRHAPNFVLFASFVVNFLCHDNLE